LTDKTLDFYATASWHASALNGHGGCCAWRLEAIAGSGSAAAARDHRVTRVSPRRRARSTHFQPSCRELGPRHPGGSTHRRWPWVTTAGPGETSDRVGRARTTHRRSHAGAARRRDDARGKPYDGSATPVSARSTRPPSAVQVCQSGGASRTTHPAAWPSWRRARARGTGPSRPWVIEPWGHQRAAPQAHERRRVGQGR